MDQNGTSLSNQSDAHIAAAALASTGPPADIAVGPAAEFDFLAPPPHTFFPFVRRLDLTPVLEFWEWLAEREYGIDTRSAMRAQMESVDGLLGPIDDLEIIRANMPIVRRLLSVVMPPAFWETNYIAAFVPFAYQPILATPRMMTFMLSEQQTIESPFGLDAVTEEHKIILSGYMLIAQHFYGMTFNFHEPMITTVLDPVIGVRRHYRLDSDNQFLRPVLIGELPELSADQIRELSDNVTDVDLWRKRIPDGAFEFHGVGIVSAVDISTQEILSRLKHFLIEGSPDTTLGRFIEIQQLTRDLLRLSDVSMIDDEGELIYDILTRTSTADGDGMAGFAERRVSAGTETIVDRVLRTGAVQVIENLAAIESPTAIELNLMSKGLHNLLVAPLKYDGETIGTVNFASPNPGDLTMFSEMALRDVTPLFAMALKRSREETNNRIQAIIRERYTAIQPAVEWRFRRAATRMFYDELRGLPPEVDEIVFEDVYPLYSISDLRGSSRQRSDAIRVDLQEHLQLALDVVQAATATQSIPAFESLAFRIERAMHRLDDGINSGDEATIIDFLRREIEPRFDRLGGMNDDVVEKVNRYRAALDPERTIVYRRRKQYEESVASVNRAIATYLDVEQVKAQAMIAHYFEKHQTDGVDFGMYVGASLIENGRFDLLDLKNLRLWQLQTVCGIARLAAAMKPTLNVPLDMAHLILVQNAPLSIRFRPDEKHFDIDGTYNVRYEIMKKRIDKALVKGTNERLTQPETIAIIYSNAGEAVEYREYIEYLQSTGHLDADVESLELEDLQEVHGLRALRVRVLPDV